MSPQETARRVLALYDGKSERWTKGTFARAHATWSVSPISEEATCWCVLGAAKRVGAEDSANYWSPFNQAVRQLVADERVSVWNDAPERTFAEVVALLERIAAEPEAKP